MGLVHIPRVLYSVGKGLIQRRRDPHSALVGVGPLNPHVYQARAGLFDVDYLGHLNNASYLVHAELARWEMSAQNNMLQTMARQDIHFLVSGVCLRYRREIRPLFRHFQVETYMAGVDERNIWMYQTFRLPSKKEGRDRVRAQLLMSAVVTQNRKVLNPTEFLKGTMGVDPKVLDPLTLPNIPQESMENMLEKYAELEAAMRAEATADDEDRHGK